MPDTRAPSATGKRPAARSGSARSAPAGERALVPAVEEVPRSLPCHDAAGTLAPMDEVDLHSPQLFINRELSFLEFNQRVLEQAKDASVPLLERVKFLGISCSNLDEFFEIRVAGLKELLEAGAVQVGPDGLSVNEQLQAIRARAVRLVEEQYQVLNQVLMPELARQGVVFLSPENWTEAQAAWLSDYFEREVVPVLSPLALDPARPFPKVLNKSLNFAIVVEGEDGFGRNSGLAIVQAPRS